MVEIFQFAMLVITRWYPMSIPHVCWLAQLALSLLIFSQFFSHCFFHSKPIYNPVKCHFNPLKFSIIVVTSHYTHSIRWYPLKSSNIIFIDHHHVYTFQPILSHFHPQCLLVKPGLPSPAKFASM